MHKSTVAEKAQAYAYDLARIEELSFLRAVEYHPTLASTNSRGLELAAAHDSEVPLLVLAERQTAGRGRGTNSWWSAPGSVTFSLVIDLDALALDPKRWPQIALTAAVGICNALELAAPELQFNIKWPNDVFCGVQKISGILPELHLGAEPRLVLGVGVNVNNSMKSSSELLVEHSTSLIDLTGGTYNLTETLISILQGIEHRFAALASGDTALSQAWMARCMLAGRTVTLRDESGEISGECRGIDPDGALRIATPSGTAAVVAGSVTHFGPPKIAQR